MERVVGTSKLIVSVSFGSQASFKWKGKSCLDGEISSWMANVRTSSFIVRIPVWNRSGLTLRAVGLSGILLPVHCVQGRCVAYRRVRRVHLLLLQGSSALLACL